MKIKISFHVLLWLMFLYARTTLSQNIYSFQKSTGTYSALSGATIVSGAAPWSPFASHTVPIGFTFNYFGINYSTIFCEGSGFCVFDPSFYFYTVHPFTVEMRDAGTGTPNSQSPISFKLEGIAPNRICKIQWQNCELKDDLGSFANFQLWLYETTNTIESRIGSCTINNAAAAFQDNGFDGPLIALYNTQGVNHYGYCVQGSNPNENLLTLNTGTIANIFQNSMSAPPPDGATYRFSPGNPSGIVELNPQEKLLAYPNPVYGNVICLNVTNSTAYKFLNSSGQLLKEGFVDKDNNKISVEEFSQGFYFLEINSFRIKIIK